MFISITTTFHSMRIMVIMLDNITKSFISSSCCYLRSSIMPAIGQISPSRAHLLYLLFIYCLGYLALICTQLRIGHHLGSLDAAFMSVSAITSSSMSTVEMEAFTNAQLIFLTLMMLLGGEVFISMLGLFLKTTLFKASSPVTVAEDSIASPSSLALAELGHAPNEQKLNFNDDTTLVSSSFQQKAVKTLAYLVLAYFVTIHVGGSLFVYMYMITVPSAAHVLKAKSIFPSTFSIFLTTSSFANCGFVPTNENMAIFKTNSVLLLLVIPQVIMGNTFYPIVIRVLIRFMAYLARKNTNTSTSTLFTYILSNSSLVGYKHLMSSADTWWLGWTGVGFLVFQIVMLTGMDWGSHAFDGGMTWFQKLVACLFQSVSSRHSGESVFDLSTLSTAVLVLFILMMYLPPYLTFMPDESDPTISNKFPAAKEELPIRSFESNKENNNKKLINPDIFMFSQLSYLAIFVVLISITERNSLKTDPLNFNVLNIVLEVVSAYGNVGLSMGYSCKRRIEANSFCEDKTYGFAGRWSKEGKLILIVVMILGKLKRFNQKGGKAWKTL